MSVIKLLIQPLMQLNTLDSINLWNDNSIACTDLDLLEAKFTAATIKRPQSCLSL